MPTGLQLRTTVYTEYRGRRDVIPCRMVDGVKTFWKNLAALS